jgi:hypothetical protein
VNIQAELEKLSHEKQIRFALFCAIQVKHLMRDDRSLDALLKIELSLDGKISKSDMKIVAYAAADAARYSANAAGYAANAAGYAANAARYSANAARYADAADTAAYDSARAKQIDFLKKLLNEGSL